MHKFFLTFLSCFMLGISLTYAAPATQRSMQISNDRVNVWTTTINPDQPLKMHRHEHQRVLVALDNGELEIENDKHQIHYLKLQQGQAYFLDKDIPGELHTDKILGEKPIIVVVVELK